VLFQGATVEYKPVVESIKLRNILSYGDEGEEIALAPLNVLIGPNASGKSNLIEAIGLLRSLPRDIAAEIRRGGGINEWLWKGSKNLIPAEIEVSVKTSELQLFEFWLRYCIAITELSNLPMIAEEVIEDGGSLRQSGTHEIYYRFQDNQAEIVQDGWSTPSELRLLDSSKEVFSRGQSILAQRKDPTKLPQLSVLADLFESISIYREFSLGPNTPFRQPQRADLPAGFLMEDGTNLGLVLSDLENRPDTRGLIQDRLKDVYPNLNYIHPNIRSGYVEVMIHEKGMRSSIPASRLSDGTLRYLCLLVILCHPEPPPLICIEEPELGLHPDLIPKVADLLLEASERTQLIVTTHSEILVSEFSDNPEVVLVCERDRDGSHLRRLEREPLQKWLEQYRLGELWCSGEIGGTRW
jgi:predicted ATPase